jgi:hypothetical protein
MDTVRKYAQEKGRSQVIALPQQKAQEHKENTTGR